MQYRRAELPAHSEHVGLVDLRRYTVGELERISLALEALETRMIVLTNHRQLADLPTRVTGGELARVADVLYVYDKGLAQWRAL